MTRCLTIIIILNEIYRNELDIKETTKSNKTTSYLDILLSFDNNDSTSK